MNQAKGSSLWRGAFSLGQCLGSLDKLACWWHNRPVEWLASASAFRLDETAMDINKCTQVFHVSKKKWWVLLTQDGKWGFEKEAKFVEFTTPSMCIPLLPLLELPRSEAVELVCEELKRISVDPEVANSFPFYNIVHLALCWKTDYWPMLAVDWLESGYPISEEFVDCLSELQSKKSFSQSLRHRAGRLIKRYERSTVD